MEQADILYLKPCFCMIFWHRFGTTSTIFLFLTYHHKVIILKTVSIEWGSCLFFLFHIASQQRCIVLPMRKHVATVSIDFSYCDLRFGIIFSDCFLTDQMRISVPKFKKQVPLQLRRKRAFFKRIAVAGVYQIEKLLFNPDIISK